LKHLLRYLILLLPLSAFSQNWEIFNSYDRYNYQASGAPLITNVLFADSFKVAGSDTIYYLNRIVQKPNYISSYDTVLKNLPQFFQKQIRRSIDGTYVFSIDSGYDGFTPDTFVIKAFANVSDNWLYDTTANITATLASQTLQILFGTTDSVKQINLSNGDSILLSKSFGIVSFPSDTLTATGKTPIYYTLAGIETRGIGDSVINFWSIYNFNVGDVFMYREDDEGAGESFIDTKYTILSKQVYLDSIKYIESVAYHQYGAGISPQSGFDTSTLTFIDSTNHFANTFPGQLVREPYSYESPSSGNTYSNYVLYPTFNLPCKHSKNVYDSIKLSGIMCEGTVPDYFECYICSGVGDTYFDYPGPESESTIQLEGYVKNGVMYGTVLDNWEILGTSDSTTEIAAISLYPNLTAAYTYVHISNAPTNRALHLAVCDLTGRQMLSQSLTNHRTKIDCTNLPAAVYIWRVLDENENVMGAGKLVKQ
jgi:hypothetical protein